MPLKSVTTLGLFNADAVYHAPRLPVLGETILGSRFALGPGGKGSNQAVAAARAGASVDFITRLGEDHFATMALALWTEAGVRAHATVDPTSHTGSAFIFVQEGTGQNSIIVAPGVGARITPADLQAARAVIERSGVFLTQLEQPLDAAFEGLRIARAAGVTTILNPAPAAALGDEMLSLCDYLTPNETEAQALTGIAVHDLASAEAAADALIARGAGAVVVTLGAQGVLYRSGGHSLHVPACTPGTVVDTTGAGDAFNGGFACALAEGQTVTEALRFGVAVAGLSVGQVGAASSMPCRAEVLSFLGAVSRLG